MEPAARGGIDINGLDNAFAIAKGQQIGGHPGDNEVVLNWLSELVETAADQGWTDAEVAAQMRTTVATMSFSINRGSFGRWF